MTTAPIERHIGRRGPKPKGGGRNQHTMRVPYADSAHFQEVAKACGLPFADWLAMVAYQATGVPIPEYITRQIEQHRDQALKRAEIQPQIWQEAG